MDKFSSKVSVVAFYLYQKTNNMNSYPLTMIESFIDNLNELPITVLYSYSLLSKEEELQVLECYIHLMKGGA